MVYTLVVLSYVYTTHLHGNYIIFVLFHTLPSLKFEGMYILNKKSLEGID